LSGRTAGVELSNRNNNQVRIRGLSSLSGQNDPTIIVNGQVFSGNISDIPADNIQSIEVKKDDSNVIYGSRAANGVVIITTKEDLKPNNEKNDEELKTWHRSTKAINAVKLLIGDNEELPLKGIDMQVKIEGFRARVTLNYYFYSTQSRAEGNFKVRMPAGASPCYFAFGSSVFIDKYDKNPLGFKDYYENDSVYLNNDRIIETKSKRWKQPKEARVVPISVAAYAYDETVRGRIDPMLAEWAGADIFNCRVFPIEQNQMHRVVIGYDVNLTNIGTDKIFDLSIPKTNSFTNVNIDIAKLNGVETIISEKKGLTESNERITIKIENPDKELISIRYKNPDNVLLIDNDDKYFASSIVVDLPKAENENLSSNAVFLIDISASSNPDKFNVWLKLLKAILENNKDRIKHFNVLFFNIETFWYKNTYVENNELNRNELISFCDKLSLEGATDIGAAILEGSSPEWEKNSVKKNIFLLSDGSISWGEENFYSINKNVNSNSRIFVYNTGISGTDFNLLDYLSGEYQEVLYFRLPARMKLMRQAQLLILKHGKYHR